MNKKLIIVTVIAAMLLAAAATGYRHYQKRYFSCTAQYYSHQKDLSLNALLRLVFNGSEGIAILTGEVTDEQQRHLALNRQMIFTFRENNSHYLMQSLKGLRENYDEVENKLLGKLLNPFFYEESQSLQYRIDHQPNGDYVVSNGKLPLAWCHNA